MTEDRSICDIVCDLIPLYVDECISDESRNVVEDHVSHCSSCSKALEKAEHAHENIDRLYDKACKREKRLQSFRRALPWITAAMILAAAAVYIYVMAPFGIGEHRPDKADMNMILEQYIDIEDNEDGQLDDYDNVGDYLEERSFAVYHIYGAQHAGSNHKLYISLQCGLFAELNGKAYIIDMGEDDVLLEYTDTGSGPRIDKMTNILSEGGDNFEAREHCPFKYYLRYDMNSVYVRSFLYKKLLKKAEDEWDLEVQRDDELEVFTGGRYRITRMNPETYEDDVIEEGKLKKRRKYDK